MLERGDHLVVAVSGGPDSVALLRALVLLSDEFRLRLTAAHLHHGLRAEEADRDEAFVRRLCAGMGMDCICKKVDIGSLQKERGMSVEEIGREERYRFLEETARNCGAAKIAVGHHREDQAETVLNHLIRGSGAAGLRGILPVRDGLIIRPLLDVGRDDIMEFLSREGLAYVIDSSNASPLFLRNRIRNELIPKLTAHYNPRLIDTLCRTAEIIRREDDYLQGVVRQIINGWGIALECGKISLPLPGFLALHEAIQSRVVKSLLEGLAPWRNGIGYRHIEAVLRLAHRADGQKASLDLPFGIRVEFERDFLRIRKEQDRRPRKARQRGKSVLFEYPVEVPAGIRLSEIGRTVHFAWVPKPSVGEMRERSETAFMDYESIIPPLVLRNARPGDRVQPLGAGGTKKLKDYFIDRKIPASLRSGIPLLADTRSIIWIAGERVCERVRVTEQTSKVLKAEITAWEQPSEMI
jgi:tRNA(Ile)-lysidine synthase